MEIVQNLLQAKENHLRGLAKALRTNQTTVSRKLDELHRENVVDYKRSGRNKVFFLKKTLEAKQTACSLELYKLLEIVRKYPRIRSVLEKIRKNPKIRIAILFGSYAKGTATKQSDIDVYIDAREKRATIKEKIENLDTRLSVKVGEYDRENLLIREIEENHVIIKGVEDFYEKNKFFE